jgi:hypothetical protein
MHEHRGTAIAIGLGMVGFLVFFAGIMVVLSWLGISVYATVKLVGGGSDAASPTVVALLFVGLVSALSMGLALLAWLLGRSMVSRKRVGTD